MKKHSDMTDNWDSLRKKLIGLGEHSVRKNYYPELQRHRDNLEELVLERTRELEIAKEQLEREIIERRKLEKEMVRLDRLNLVGELAAGIAHEIRNPMTTVRGFLQMFMVKPTFTPYFDNFELMIEELDRANAIITEFLSLAKHRSVELRRQSLNSIIETLYPLMTSDAIFTEKAVNFELQVIPELVLDEKEIRQLIINLVRNGLEAMKSSGQLTIKTFMDGNEIVLSIQDQGSGIEPYLLEKIGTPFFTTKEQGTGLGLPVCYSIAARHNATLKFETGPNGTTFFIRFRISPSF